MMAAVRNPDWPGMGDYPMLFRRSFTNREGNVALPLTLSIMPLCGAIQTFLKATPVMSAIVDRRLERSSPLV